MKIYISLPITGKDEKTQRRTARMWKLYWDSKGHTVINPFDLADRLDSLHRIGGLKPPTYREYMEVDLAELQTCDAIFFVNGWSESKGCIEEAEKAIICSIKPIFERTL
jgi:hypothetical protein